MVFRLALTALSQPALAWPAADLVPPRTSPLPPLTAALTLTLLDQDTPVWLSPSFADSADWLRFHAGAPLTDDPSRALFILAASPAERPPLEMLAQGSARYPDRSATVILGGALPGGDADPWLAEGPGIKGRRRFAGHGLAASFLTEWRANRAASPLGVDMFLVGGGTLAGLPRSTELRPWPNDGVRLCM
jgi:alpha-D-ribose 1-methylphosphonate 5-triphosphate synthase subunit PhnH